jgi:hypothetical protein
VPFRGRRLKGRELATTVGDVDRVTCVVKVGFVEAPLFLLW